MLEVAEPEFANQIVVVTGAGSGIGRATAIAVSKQGATVALIDRSEEGLAETKGMLADGAGHSAYLCDVASVEEVVTTFGAIGERYGAVDVLVNNAGINPIAASSLDVDEAFYDLVMDVNAKGMFFCAREATRAMIPRKQGAIVNLGSVSGMIGWGGSSVYSASKGAVIALTKALAMELAPNSIRVNAVCPGSVRTPMVENNLSRLPDVDAAWESTASLHPLGRVGTPEDIAEAILYLASPRSSFVTGTCLVIDGGLIAR